MAVYEISSTIEVPKTMLTLTGVWPVPNPSFWYRLRGFVTIILTFLQLSLMSVQIVVTRKDLFNLSDILFIFFQFVDFTLKLFFFIRAKHSVFNLSRGVQDPMLTTYDESQIIYVQNASQRTSFIANAFKVSCMFSIIIFSLRPFVENKVFPVPFPFFHEGPMWYVVYLFQVISVSIGSWTHSALDTLFIGYMGIALAELDILIQKLKNFASAVTSKESQDVHNYLSDCCRHHNKIIKLVKNVEEVFTKGILVQYFCSTVIICNSGFHLILTDFLSSKFVSLIAYFATIMIELAMYCWFGNEIILKSLEIGDACFSSEWYNFRPQTNKFLLIIMERAKRPLTISAYRFSVVSLVSYIKVIQCSYSYLTALQKLYTKE